MDNDKIASITKDILVAAMQGQQGFTIKEFASEFITTLYKDIYETVKNTK